MNAGVILTDRPERAPAMIEHDRGVVVEEAFVLKQVDENFLRGAVSVKDEPSAGPAQP